LDVRGFAWQIILIIALLLASAWCFLNAWATLDLFYNHPGANRQATAYIVASGAFLAAAAWRLVIVIIRQRRGRAA
jgi:hypothetical protein